MASQHHRPLTDNLLVVCTSESGLSMARDSLLATLRCCLLWAPSDGACSTSTGCNTGHCLAAEPVLHGCTGPACNGCRVQLQCWPCHQLKLILALQGVPCQAGRSHQA